MSTEAQLKALSNSELASGTQIPALKHRTVNDAIIEEMYDAQSRGNVLSGVQTATSLASGDEVFVIRSGEAYLLDADELGFVSTLADLTDVNIPAPSNDQVLAYNFGTSKWVSKDVSSLSSVVSITGTATTNQMVKFTGLSSIGNSIVSDNGTTVNIGGNLSVDNNITVGTINSGTSTDFVKGDGSLDGTTYQDEAEKNQANGYAPLDSGAKIPLANLPDSILGQVSYQGTWAASSNTPTLANPPASTTKGEYYVASDDGTQFGIEFKTGDWIISNGTAWEKVDNTDAVTSVFGRLGNIIALQEDYDDFYVTLDTFQEISSIKNFNGGLNSLRVEIQSAAGTSSSNSQTRIANIVGNFLSATGTNGIGFNESNNIYFTKDNNFGGKGGVLAWNNTENRTYTLPDASGTFAFTSDLDDYVTLDTEQTITGFKTFTNIEIDSSAGLRFEQKAGVSIPADNITTIQALPNDDIGFLFGLGSNNYKYFTFSSTLLTNNVPRTINIPDASGTLALTTDLNTLNASNITTGTLADARLSSNVALKDVDNNFSVGQTIGGNTTINGSLTVDTSTTNPGRFVGVADKNLWVYTDSGGAGIGTGAGGTGAANYSSLIYMNSDSSTRFFTNGTERMRIDSSGNVGIGTSSPDVKLDVDGEIRASNGILFGTDTAAANALDDYEEGTFTPTYIGSDGGAVGGYGVASGTYTKVGNVVTLELIISASKGTISGDISIGGIPYAGSSYVNMIPRRRFATDFQLFGLVVASEILLFKIKSDELSPLPITDADFNSVESIIYNDIRATITYITA
jgi:hypothetical protein